MITKTFKSTRIIALAAVLFMPVSLSGCDYAKNQLKADRSGNMEIQDYKDALAPRLTEIEDKKAQSNYDSIPDLQPYVASGADINAMPLVSISVNQTIPLRDVLYELAQQAEYDIELDPRITGAIIFSAREKPLDEVIDRISDIAGLRYMFEGETLRIQLDTPYNKTYKVDYLNIVRSSSSSVSNNVSVVSGDGADTGSEFETSFETEADFWTELEAGLQQILAAADTDILRTDTTPQIGVAEQNPNVSAVAAADGNVQVSPPDVNLNVGALPVGDGGGFEAPELSYAINRQAGILQIFAPHRSHMQIADYLKVLRRSATAQVLIEAKVLEVSLTDEFATGIDWNNLDIFPGRFSSSFSTTVDGALPVTGATNTTSAFLASFSGDNINVVAEALSEFGTVKGLASPRLTVLNNQAAVLNVATNVVYFEIDQDTTTGTGGSGNTITQDVEVQNVPEGVLINVLPSVNLDNGTISMAVRPTVTRIAQRVDDPVVAGNEIPEMVVQEIDSIIQVNSGQAVVMGGLLEDRSTNAEAGVPGLSEVPLLGTLFEQHEDTITKTELVILLKATILDDPRNTIHNTDRDLYRRFSDDRRPFRL